MLWPLDAGRYGLDVTFSGDWGCEDAEQESARLSRAGMANTIRREPDGAWTVRLGPLHSLDVARALSALLRRSTDVHPATDFPRPARIGAGTHPGRAS